MSAFEFHGSNDNDDDLSDIADFEELRERPSAKKDKKKSAQDKLFDLRAKKEKKEKKDQKEEKPVKRGRGRPPKVKKEEKTVTFDDPDEGFMGAGEGGFDDEGDVDENDEAGKLKEKVALKRKIEALRSKLGGHGTGMPALLSYPVEKLREEYELIVSQIDERRCDAVVEKWGKKGLSKAGPLLEAAATALDPTHESVDLDGMEKAIEDNYDDLFADAITQLSIMYGDMFSMGPVGDIVSNMVYLAQDRNENNMKQREYIRRNGIPVDDNDEDLDDLE